MMELPEFVRLIVVLVPMVSGQHKTGEENREMLFKNGHIYGNYPQQGPAMCDRLSKEPYFENEMLLGKPWRVYYVWNVDLQNQCLDMSFLNATMAMITRTYNDMSEFLATEPNWDAATLMVKVGREKHEMLLFADQGPAGRVLIVPNVLRDGTILPTKRSMPLLSFHLKLINGGKYLLMADCNTGVTMLSTRKSRFPIRSEIIGIVSDLDIGSGHHTCQAFKNKNKNVRRE